MKRITLFATFLIFTFALLACSSRETISVDATSNDAEIDSFDGPVILDSAVDASPDMGNCNTDKIGEPCTKDEDCEPKAQCLILEGEESGACTCTCTPDDPETPLVSEDDCPKRSENICATLDSENGLEESFCLKKCKPELGKNDCKSPLACSPLTQAYFTNLLHQPVCVTKGCITDADCPLRTEQTCDTENSTCETGQTCEPVVVSSKIGRCSIAGKCDTQSGLCATHTQGNATASVGDPCNSDLDCGNNMLCMLEEDDSILKSGKENGPCQKNSDCCSESCKNGTCEQGYCLVNFHNGYCTVRGCAHTGLTDFQCPSGTLCNRLFYGGICMNTCDLTKAEDCRGNPNDYYGAYDCRDYSKLSLMDGTKPVEGAVCDFGFIMRCHYLSGVPVGCAAVGLDGNSTQMECRNIMTGVKTSSPYDKTGFCLDNTASGTQFRAAP